MRCRYCGGRIYKVLLGWFHYGPTDGLHVARPRREVPDDPR